jgi:thiol-disulfide isomerase/thioredoxin
MRIVLLVFLLIPSASLNAAPPAGPMLFWSNGDSLRGELVSATKDTLTWKSPTLFAEPLQLELSALSSIQFPEIAGPVEVVSDDEFQITMINGNVVFGTITGVDSEAIRFRSARHGTMRLLRRQIGDFRRRQGRGAVFSGLRGLDGWSVDATGKNFSGWRQENDGSLTTPGGDTQLRHKMKFPDRCEVEVTVASSSVPDFAVTLGTNDDNIPRVEMWGDELIARCDPDFVELQRIPQDQREIHFHLFVDFPKKVMAVYSSAGRLLGKKSSGTWESPRDGIVFHAMDSDLTIKYLRVAQWDGMLPQPLLPGESRVHLRDGTIHYGTLAGLTDDRLLRVNVRDPLDSVLPTDESANEGDVIDVPVSSVSRVVVSTDVEKSTAETETRISWRDGGFISGELVSMDHDSVTMSTEHSNIPITSALAGVGTIALPLAGKTDAEPDRLFFDGGSLGGHLTLESGESDPIRWVPVGGLNSTTLISRSNARFQRGEEPGDLMYDAVDAILYPDVVYLENGDVFPCRLKGFDRKFLRIASPVMDTRQISNRYVKAIELGASDRSRHEGFGDGGWQYIFGRSRSASEVNVLEFSQTNTGFGHESIITGDDVSFHMKWGGQTHGAVTIWLYAEKLRAPQNATPVTFSLSPHQIQVSDKALKQDQGPRWVPRNVVGAADNDGSVAVKKQEARIRLLTRDGRIHVYVNNKEIKTIALNPEGVAARGLLFSTALTQTSVRVRGFAGRVTDSLKLLEIRDFKVQNFVGASVKQFIQEETRLRTLTIPRFRRDDPPTHVVLAPNGDLLRGRLLGFADGIVRFESRLEEFRFPRERIATVIWLRPDGADAADAEPQPETAVQMLLDHEFRLTMIPQKMINGQLIGESPGIGSCRVPANAIRDLFLGAPEGRKETLSYAHWIPRNAREPEWDLSDNGAASSVESDLIGKPAVEFELPTLDGGTFRLSDHADKVVVLDFWATWCGPCVAALPEYIAATDTFAQKDVIFVAVNLEEPVDRIRAFLDRQNLSPDVALDRGSVIARQFGVSGIPHTVVLGPGNIVKHVKVGFSKGAGQKLSAVISELLEERADGG